MIGHGGKLYGMMYDMGIHIFYTDCAANRMYLSTLCGLGLSRELPIFEQLLQ